MKHFLGHLQKYIFRGFLAIIPIFLCYLAVKLLHELIDKKVIGFLDRFVEVTNIPGLGILLVLIALYLLGLFVGNLFGRAFLAFLEGISERIPLIKTVYSLGKQLSQSLDVNNQKSGFQKAVLVQLKDPKMLVPGFVTGKILDQHTNEELVIVFFPTSPTPTQGFTTALKKDQIIDPGWSVEEGFKVVVSAGIIAPKVIARNLA